MAESAGGPFRERSLERLSSPERLDQLLRIVDRKSWLPLIALGVLILAIVLWSVFGEVPVNVEGRGILVRPRGIVEFQSPGSGYVQNLFFAVGDEIERGEVLARISRPDLDKRLQLQREKLVELKGLGQIAEILRVRGDAASGDSLESHVDDVRSLALDIQLAEDEAVDEERERIEDELRDAQDLEQARRRSRDGLRVLREQGLISDLQLLDGEEVWLDSVSRVSRLEAQLRGLETRELEVDESYLDRLRRIADFKLEMQDYAQEIHEVEREIKRIRVALAREAKVTAEHSGRILEIATAQGQFVSPGARLGSMEVRSASSPLEALTYFSVKDGKRLHEERHPRILITPDTVERQRYGGLVGTVHVVSPFPVTLSEAESQIGNREVADSLLAGGYRIQVRATLTPGEIPGEYLWSSSSSPDVAISVGTTTTARVAVERRRPITFVLPFLKEAMGVD